MAAAERSLVSWLSATVDVLVAVLGFVILWYPMVSLGNAVVGEPASAALVDGVVGVLALAGAYTLIAGEWELGGRLGEYVLVLVASAIGWGVVGMLFLVASGVSLSGENPLPQALVWAAAYLTAYLVVFRSTWSIFD